MKVLIYFSLLSIVAAGCAQKNEPPKEEKRVDNSATRYALSLKYDAMHAKEVAKKANAAVAAQDNRMQEADEQTK